MIQMRKAFGVTKFGKIPRKAVLRRLKMTHTNSEFERRRWNYFGHVYRYPKARHAEFLLTAAPEFDVEEVLFESPGSAPETPGRPKETWLSQIKNTMDRIKKAYIEYGPPIEDPINSEVAKNKEPWAKLIEPTLAIEKQNSQV